MYKLLVLFNSWKYLVWHFTGLWLNYGADSTQESGIMFRVFVLGPRANAERPAARVHHAGWGGRHWLRFPAPPAGQPDSRARSYCEPPAGGLSSCSPKSSDQLPVLHFTCPCSSAALAEDGTHIPLSPQ